MKKLIAALFAAVLMAAGLVAATGSTASANCTPSQYQGCTATTTQAKTAKNASLGNQKRVCGKVTAVGSTARPTGRLIFKIKSVNGFFQKETVSYAGGKVCTTTRQLDVRGPYTLTVKYKSPAGSIFKNSTGTKAFTVR